MAWSASKLEMGENRVCRPTPLGQTEHGRYMLTQFFCMVSECFLKRTDGPSRISYTLSDV